MTSATAAKSVILCALALIGACSLRSITEAESEAWRKVATSEPRSYTYEAVCSVHHRKTIVTVVPAYGGFSVMPPKEYVRARLRLFPNSWPYVNTGWCEQTWVDHVERGVCPACRAAE